ALFTLDSDRRPVRSAPALVFPFGEYALTSKVQERAVSASRPRVETEPVAVISARLETLLGGPERGRIALLILALILMAVGIAAYRWMGPSGNDPAYAQETKPSLLALRVNRSGEDFEISWDHSSKAVRQASHGTLIIQDGGTTRTVQFDGRRLREGKILY